MWYLDGMLLPNKAKHGLCTPLTSIYRTGNLCNKLTKFPLLFSHHFNVPPSNQQPSFFFLLWLLVYCAEAVKPIVHYKTVRYRIGGVRMVVRLESVRCEGFGSLLVV